MASVFLTCLLQMTTDLYKDNNDEERKAMPPKAITATPLNRSCGNNHKSHPGAP